MSPRRRENQRVVVELDELVARQILTPGQANTLKERYPTTAWDVLALVRSVTVLGVLTAMAGLVILAREHMNWWLMAEAALGVAFLVGVGLGYWLKHYRAMPALGEALELAGAVALQGLTVVLATHYSSGSEHWPPLIGVDALLLTALAYLVANRLVLWYGCANFFFYFGAETGYVSGWGAYYLGMTYPVRFLAVGAATLLLAWLHALVIRGRWASFSRVYAHFGLLVTNLALWFLSLFGYYENLDISWSDTQGERLVFSLLWAALAGACLYAGARMGLQLLRSYGLTFLIINIYTFYFQFVVPHSGELWFLHLLLCGGSLLWLGFYLERRHSSTRRDQPDRLAPQA
ncbi:hypothetical protein [uncultured Thiodictyon sp.]|uniref:hypothetical protein n=1 Tax=uncultured Thiodictyon sp. TaxID=1846217 RepID=UPI0025F60A13|nr:hypothetical protein [uncultured Thiodictyon sp.]